MISKNFKPFVEPHYTCDFCGEVVVNPICPFCLTTEINAWLTLYPDLRKTLTANIYKYLNKFSNLSNVGVQCIKCKDNRASVCPHCFTEFIFEELKKINANRIIVHEFLDFFNFDFPDYNQSKQIFIK